jgi:hypothetical protein
VTLNWSGAQAPAGIARYEIYRDGVLLATVTTTATSGTYTDTTASPLTTHRYRIVTIDAQNRPSAPSAELAVTTARPLEVFTPLP